MCKRNKKGKATFGAEEGDATTEEGGFNEEDKVIYGFSHLN